MLSKTEIRELVVGYNCLRFDWQDGQRKNFGSGSFLHFELDVARGMMNLVVGRLAWRIKHVGFSNTTKRWCNVDHRHIWLAGSNIRSKSIGQREALRKARARLFYYPQHKTMFLKIVVSCIGCMYVLICSFLWDNQWYHLDGDSKDPDWCILVTILVGDSESAGAKNRFRRS